MDEDDLTSLREITKTGNFEILLAKKTDLLFHVKKFVCGIYFAVSIFSPDLLLKPTASCNFGNTSPLTCRFDGVKNKCPKKLK